MNILDIIILAILAYAVYSGMKDGVIIQVCSLLGIVIGLSLGSSYCDTAAALLGIGGEYSSMWGYAIVVVATVIVVSVAAYTLRKMIKFAGLGIFDMILGVALSLCKYLLILSILFSVFITVNSTFNIIGAEQLASSRLFLPIANLTNWFSPAWEWTESQIQSI